MLLFSCKTIPNECHCRLFHTNDLDQAKLCAKQCERPILILFTGWATTNAYTLKEFNKMEGDALETLKQHYVTAELYVDEKRKMPYVQTYQRNGRQYKIETIGHQNSLIQTEQFNSNSQPYYVIMSSDGNEVIDRFGYQTSIEEFNKRLLDNLQ